MSDQHCEQIGEISSPISHPQKRIWYLERINDDLPLHTIGGCINIYGKVNVQNLKRAIQKTVENNQSLHVSILDDAGYPHQLQRKHREKEVDFHDFSKEYSPLASYESWVRKVFSKKFDLRKKLFSFPIYKVSDDHYGFLIAVHHIISDGWSVNLIDKEIRYYYENFQNQLDVTPVARSDYSEYLRFETEYLASERCEKNKFFWLDKFSDLPKEFLYKSTLENAGRREVYQLDLDLSKRLKAFSEYHRCSLNLIFIMMFAIYINKTEDYDDIVIGVPVYNRFGKKQKNTIGMFTSTLPFRFSINKNESVSDFLNRLKYLYKDCLLNQKYPYDLLIQDLGLNKMRYDSLFKMSVNYYNTQFDDKLDGMRTQADEYYCGCQSYQFQLTIKEWNTQELTLNFDYKTAEVNSETITQMYSSFQNMMEAILADTNIKIEDVSLESESNARYKLYDINQTTTSYLKKTVDKLFEDIAELNPDKIALKFEGRSVSYQQFNHLANQFARHLLKQGVSTGSVIGVMMTHSVDIMVAIFGVLKAGCTYLPIDVNYPEDRIHFILKHSNSVCIIVNQGDKHINLGEQHRVIDYRYLHLEEYAYDNVNLEITVDDIAYIIYTSGSTGTPKGVMIRHGGLTNYTVWANKMYLKDENETMALYSSISFDLTVTTLFMPLISGNTIAIYRENEAEDFVLYRILKENITTVIKLTPAHLELIKSLDNRDSIIKRLIVGGDELKTSVSRSIHDSFAGEIEIFNEYGPTETVVGCMIHKFDIVKDTDFAVPIGKPADNVQVYVLDKNLKIVPNSVVGDLYIAGDGLAWGYLKQEELTCQKFIPNPFTKNMKMYHSGDLARYSENGLIYYAGRADNQIKLKGFRIELGEIESCLTRNQSINQAIVMVNPNHDEQLIAYVIAESNCELVFSELSSWLKKYLPYYMIPAQIIEMTNFPLTVNGKLDFDAFPKPDINSSSDSVGRQVLTNNEKELINAMQPLLSANNIDPLDNYFRLGGDSIKAIQISSLLKNKGLQLKVKDILSLETIEEIAASIILEKGQAISQEECTGSIEPTPITKWYFENFGSRALIYNQYIFFTTKVRFNPDIITQAVDYIIKQHDSLKIHVTPEDSKLFYSNANICNPDKNVIFDSGDSLSPSQMREEGSHICFDINDRNMFCVTVFNMPNNEQAFVFTAHHLLVDGVSWRIILDDFFSAMHQLGAGKIKIDLPLKTTSYQQWAEYLNTKALTPDKRILSYCDTLTKIPFELPMIKQGAQSEFRVKISEGWTLSQNVLKKIHETLFYIYDLDLNEVLIIALALTLHDVTEHKDIIIDLERHGRDSFDDIDVSRTVGWFTNIFPLLLTIDDNLSLEENIKLLKDQYREIDRISIYYGICKYLSTEAMGIGNCPVRFNFLGDTDHILNQYSEMGHLEFGLETETNSKLSTQMDLLAVMANHELKLSVRYCENVLSTEFIAEFMDTYILKIEEMIEQCKEKDSRVFTPSDFETAELSQSDLDSILF